MNIIRFRYIFATALAISPVASYAQGNAAQAPPQPPATTTSVPDNSAYILTPPAPHTPQINGASIYGERPGHPFFYAIPVSGDRPITFTAKGLPKGLMLDPATGFVSGTVSKSKTYKVTFTAANTLGSDSKAFKIVIGDKIALTPPMGWNSYNVYNGAVNQDKVIAQANAMISTGLAQHGWTYVNTDDSWQGPADPVTHVIKPNDKFPDIGAMVKTIHSLGLKAGIYGTPWIGSYGAYPGESADTLDRVWVEPAPDKRYTNPNPYHDFGKYSFIQADAKQYADWGFDYFKYDWNPNDVEHVKGMSDALNSTSRDIVFSLSNSATLGLAPEYAKYANAWRMTGDIIDTYESLGQNAFETTGWTPYAGPGHWNDPDMMVLGDVGWGNIRPTALTPDEQYTHMSLWCLLSAPLILGCDLTQMDSFTLSLLTNDEVLAIDQDSLGKSATRVYASDDTVVLSGRRPYARRGVMNTCTLPRIQVWAKPMADGSYAVGLFNLGPNTDTVTADFASIGLQGAMSVRDLWRQTNLGKFTGKFTAGVPSHGVVLVRMSSAK